MLVTRAEIAGLIPHTGPMCLLDGVLQWDSSRIRCISRSHHAADNPLRADGRLPAVCGIEYAAQAMAVHGGLARQAGSKPRRGLLASVRDMACSRDRLDDLDGDLIVDAELEAGDGNRVIYRFTLRVGDVEVLNGRAAVVLDPSSPPFSQVEKGGSTLPLSPRERGKE
jgi:predicted hotdog family 3-hydroxylacyl-ACP dehydratase